MSRCTPASKHRCCATFLILTTTLLFGGCAKVPYQYGGLQEDRNLPVWRDTPQIETGQKNIILDVLGNIYSLPSKMILLDWRIGNHNISPETAKVLETYLQENDLNNVKVRINQYAPGAEWCRLFKNRSMNIFWRATFGLLSTTIYTILPGRVFGGDNYNPYTNTISIYSDHPAILLHEGGHAKDLYNRPYKGLYSAIYVIPGVALWHEAEATGDTIGYLRDKEQVADEKSAYRILYPAYGTYLGGALTDLFPVDLGPGYLIQLGVAIPGHLVGQIKAVTIDEKKPVRDETTD